MFVSNANTLELLRSDYNDLYVQIENSVNLNGFVLEEISTVSAYCLYMDQKGIDRYNNLFADFNQIVNRYWQNRKDVKPVKHNRLMFRFLRKQILADRTSAGFVPPAYSEEQELVSDVKDLLNDFHSFFVSPDLFARLNEYDMNSIWVSGKGKRALSKELFGSWDSLDKKICESMKDKSKKKVEKFMKSKFFRLADLNAVDSSLVDKIGPLYAMKMNNLKSSADILATFFSCDGKTYFKGDREKTGFLKGFMDALLGISSFCMFFFPDPEYEIDSSFYNQFGAFQDIHTDIYRKYNKVRNFMTQKSLAEGKFKLNFDSSELANGWDRSKEFNSLCFILRKDGKYYLAIHGKGIKDGRVDKSEVQLCTDGEVYEKMYYKQVPDARRDLPRIFFSKGDPYRMCSDVYERLLQCRKLKKAGIVDYWISYFDSKLDFSHKLIAFYQNAISKYEGWSEYEMRFRDPESYETEEEFYDDVESQSYFIKFEKVSANEVGRLVDEGKIYLFEIYNKDFSPNSTGTKNLHTIYWEALFSERNLKTKTIKLNGQAELFFRPASREKDKPITHPIGSYLVNRYTCDNPPTLIPGDIYKEIYEYENGLRQDLSSEAESYRQRLVVKKASQSITKGNRFRTDQFSFHVPLTFNFNCKAQKDSDFNNFVVSQLVESGCNVIGIDRGEHNLLYICVVDCNGHLLYQKSLNVVGLKPTNYQEKLNDVEKSRDFARKTWDEIEKIKDLKEGYLSNVVSEIAKLMIDYNAVVFLENLNYAFKRGRFKIEKQVYQKFELALINKLNYLVFKNRQGDQIGSPLNAYQLTNKLSSFEKLHGQSGCLFYIPASYTSKVDPVTGFTNLFQFDELTTVERIRDFFGRFDSISYDCDTSSFVFSFDYNKFNCSVTNLKKSCWDVYSRGERLVFDSESKTTVVKYPTSIIVEAMESEGIDFQDSHNLISEISSLNNGFHLKEILYALKISLQLRNRNDKIDYILSPVKSSNGTFFDSRCFSEEDSLPCDADANGAYNIARKGLLAIENMKHETTPNALNVKAFDWFNYIMK